MNKQNALYIVATPIGNLSDITLRALEILKSVAIIAAEDTRHSAKLLSFHGVDTPLCAYHDHGGEQQVDRLLTQLRNGASVALISDAGTPLISDPGYRLVVKVREEGFTVVPIPGPCALIAALSSGGLPSDRFSFEGFPPAKKVARQNQFEALLADTRTLIFYESTHRILDSLQDMLDVFGRDRKCVIARELTKNYETFLSGALDELIATLKEDTNQQRGEFVVMVSGFRETPTDDALAPETQRVLKLLLEELPVKQASNLASKITGEKKNKLYQLALSWK